ncbi:hypothetical protein RM96_16705 [Cupriavidus sp. IDO]|nr:hypothetical protein RM96_16705 [Cupriavidus sp. IDO]
MRGGAEVGRCIGRAAGAAAQLQFVVEIDVEQRQLTAPAIAIEVRADFIRLGLPGRQAIGGLRDLEVLQRAERIIECICRVVVLMHRL